jgi:SAM-dependent methyltransferase
MSLLHLAPEHSIERLLRGLPQLAYTTADIASPLADERFDITAIPRADESFDAIICSHVLEHVDDDRAAMRELRRVLRPGGWAIVMVPVDDTRAETYEDPTITEPAERRRAFHQEDHVRVYGRDFPERLRAAGFEVTLDDFAFRLDAAARRRYGASAAPIPVCRRPA